MAAQTYTANVSLILSLLGSNGVNQQTPLLPWTSSSSPGQSYTLTLNPSDNTIVVPQSPQPTASVVIIAMPTGVTLTLKGAASDAGYPMGQSTVFPFLVIPVGLASGPGGFTGSFILNASAQTTVTVWFL